MKNICEDPLVCNSDSATSSVRLLLFYSHHTLYNYVLVTLRIT